MFIFICTAILAAVLVGIKFTQDIFPRPLKIWLCKKAVSNWMNIQPQKFGKPVVLEPKTFADTGLLADEQEISVERPAVLTNPALRDEYIIYGTDEEGNGVSVKMTRFSNNQTHADVLISLQDGMYQASYKGETPSAYDFSLGNLKMEMAEPFRIWRIWYNGIMTFSSKQNKKKKLVHVVFNFLWKALEGPVDNRKNGNANLLANHLCCSHRFGENLPSLLKLVPEGYSQMGAIQGTLLHGEGGVNINDQNDSDNAIHLYLYGFRTREIISSFGFTTMFDVFSVTGESPTFLRDDARRLELFAISNNGDGFRLKAVNDEWTDGRMLWASYAVSLITNIDCSPSLFSNDSTIPKLFNIFDGKRTSKVEIWSLVRTLQLSNGSRIAYLKLTINGENANGVLILKYDALKAYKNSNKATEQENIASSIILQNQVGNRTCEHHLSTPKVYTHQKNDDFLCNIDASSHGEVFDKSSYFLEFCQPFCLKVPQVGGKGASLAKLQAFTQSRPDAKVKTARGFCITTALFRELLDLEKFSDILKHATSNGDQTLEDSCSLVIKRIKSSDAEKRISTLISQRIETVFGKENRNKIRFAVRSSGVLEDGADLSCAGQNETFLGVSQDFVAKKVVECWASLFTAQSVRYRLNHGQPAVSEMGVVVQEMVDATRAGVIFTADPRTGNPFQMIITANYGLGESVVSGSCDPDTITLMRVGQEQSGWNTASEKCTENFHNGFIMGSTNNKWWTDVTIREKVLGEKRTKIICTAAVVDKERDIDDKPEDGNSTMEISMANQESQQFCLDEETAIKLGIVAAEIELFMGHHKPVDIEWAIDQSGQIFILQCRNLTALDAWSDFEILHELDAGVRTKLDRFTTANSGEVLPKAIHAIGQTVSRCLDITVQKQVYLRKGDPFPLSPYTNNSCPIFQQRLHINMFQTLYATVEKEITTASICIDQTVFGRQVIDEEIREIAAKRFGIASGSKKLRDLYLTIKMFRAFKSLAEEAEKEYKNFKLDYACIPQNSLDIYQQLSKDMIHLYNTCTSHLVTTQSSSGSQFFLFLFLSEGKKPSEWDSSLFEDASKLLSVFANVESAELPEDMDQLGDQIIRHAGELKNIIENFLEVSSDKALEWLRGNDKVSQALHVFFEKHGHRGFAELDIGESSWKSAPHSFLPILRNMLKNKIKQKDNVIKSKTKSAYQNDDELLNSLSSNLKPMTRRLLKFILPTCRNAVVCREKTKSLFVRVLDQFKQQYNKLAQLMVKEHLLPSTTLLVHLTHFEIGLLVNKDVSSSTILQKAMKRQKMYPLMEKTEFPEIFIGIPRKIDMFIPVTITDTIQATPVSRGVAKGIAKVCLSVEEASESLQPGDILITHGTDIAWSPFFPILGGVVTELGGLISHGAVVAREYGLPCIVGAINATKIFQSGDTVILDAGKGTLSKTQE